MTITWHGADDIAACTKPAPQEKCWCRVLCADLRDARLLPFLRPAPLPSDYKDEARPATNDRAYFLARRALSRSLLGAIAVVDGDAVHVRYDEDGAPCVLHPAGLFVSVSGHGPYALIAVSNCHTGVDFEAVLDDVEPVADVLHPNEQHRLAALLPAEKSKAFLHIWTAKESYLKALGRGFLEDPAKVCTHFRNNVIAIEDASGLQAQVSGQIRTFDLDGTPVIASCVIKHID